MNKIVKVNMAMAMPALSDNSRVEPVFIKNSDKDEVLEPYEVCMAVGRIVGNAAVDGVQNITGIWRIYLKSLADRAKLLIKREITIQRKVFQMYDKNPVLLGRYQGECERITIKDLPLSVASSEIEQYLSTNGVEMVSPIKYAKIRDENGDLTNFKNGNRFVFVKAPVWPLLPRTTYIADIKCKFFHDGQFKSHCTVCNTPGHRIGDDTCQARNVNETIIPFRSHHNVLSNFYMCGITVFGETFPSAEHAYQWKKAIDIGNNKLASDILVAEHAGKAKRLSKTISAELSKQWEHNSLPAMSSIIEAKAAQVPEFRKRLLETEGSYLAEATTDKYWASGLSADDTEKISPKFHPGENKLGHLLMEIRDILLCVADDMTEDETQINQTPGASVFTDVSEKTPPRPSGSSEQGVSEHIFSQPEQVTKSNTSSTQPVPKKEATQLQSKQSVMTNIKGILTHQKEKTKRKSSKTPEKEKGTKIQRQQKAGK